MTLARGDEAKVRTVMADILTGPVTLAQLAACRAVLAGLSRPGMAEGGRLDLSGVTALDTAGAWLIVSFQASARALGHSVIVTGASAAQTLLLQTVADAMPQPRKTPRRRVIMMPATRWPPWGPVSAG